MPQTLSPSPAELRLATVAASAPRGRTVLLALGLLLGASGIGYLATSQLQPAPAKPAVPSVSETTSQRSTLEKAGLDKASLAALDVSGFQRRGNFLVGETTTRAGVRLRLVLDARSHDLVGLRVVETEAGAPR
jgi:hypothetical protein